MQKVPILVQVQVSVARAQLRRLKAMVGAWWPIEETGATAHDRALVTIGFPNARIAASELVAMADHLEVLSPAEVRTEMVERGRRLVTTYSAYAPVTTA